MPLVLFMAEKKVTLTIEGMHCEHCAAAIKDGLKKAKGVKNAEVLFSMGKAKVTYDPDATKVEDLTAIVKGLGYQDEGTRALTGNGTAYIVL